MPEDQGKEAGKRQQSLMVSFLSLAVIAGPGREFQQCTGPYHGPSWKELESSACLYGQAGPGRVTPLKRPDPKAWGSGVISVMGAEAIELGASKGHRMGSEPFQFTDAPFHLVLMQSSSGGMRSLWLSSKRVCVVSTVSRISSCWLARPS